MKDVGPVPFPPTQSRPPPGVLEPPSLATTFLCSRDGALFSTQPHMYTAQLYSVPFAPHNQEENSLEGREGWESRPERVLGSGERPASVAPIAEADLLLVSVGEDVGFAGEFGEHGVQPTQVVVELLLQIFLGRICALQVAQAH